MASKKVEVILGAKDTSGPAFRSAKGSIMGVTKAQMAMAAASAAAAVAIVGLAVKGARAAADLVRDVGNIGDHFDKMSMRLGESTEDLSRWEYAVRLNGGSTETYEKAVKKLNQTIYDAGQGLATYTRLFDDLGVAYQNSDGTMRSSTEVMLDMADALGKIESQSKRNAIASKMMGRGGTEMLPVLQQGTAALREQLGELDKLGGVMDTDFTKSAAALVDAELRIETAWRGLKVAFGGAFLSETSTVVNDIAYGIGEFANEIRENKDDIQVAFLAMAGSAVIMSDAIMSAAEGFAQLNRMMGAGLSAIGQVKGDPTAMIVGAAMEMQNKMVDDAIDKVQELNARLAEKLASALAAIEKNRKNSSPEIPGPTPTNDEVVADDGPSGMFAAIYQSAAENQQPGPSARDAADDAGDAIEGGMFAAIVESSKQIDTVGDQLEDVGNIGAAAFEQIGAQAFDAFAMMLARGGDVGDMLKNMVIQFGLMGIKSAIGLPGFAAGGTIPSAAAGYSVSGGLRGIDSVPILAQHGEEVVSRRLSQRLDRFLGMVEVGQIGSGGGGGGASPTVVMQIARPISRSDFVSMGRDARRAVLDANKAVF